MTIYDKIDTLEPAWTVLTEILKDRREALLNSWVLSDSENNEVFRGRIREIDSTISILDNLKSEALNAR
ncbi:MAG: hypothetical protein MN733_09955 [Nitrososphaera sp.]|nr:hypothetical protein [Nitrososphaera sp.]